MFCWLWLQYPSPPACVPLWGSIPCWLWCHGVSMGTALLQEQPRAPLCLPSVGISPILQGQTPEGQGKPAWGQLCCPCASSLPRALCWGLLKFHVATTVMGHPDPLLGCEQGGS